MLNQLSQATIQIPYNFLLELETSIYTESLYEFVKASWHIVEPDVEFVDGWHIRAICQYLEAVYENKIGDLVISIPPRHMKSLLVDVFFPAWVWSKSPSRKFMCLSYAESTIAEHTKKCKKLVKSDWYQEHFNVPMEIAPDTDTKFANRRGGFMYAFGFSGAYTGGGADFLLIDDPLKAADSDSDAERTKVNKDYDDAVANRLNDPKTGHRILIMQRLHQADLVGHIISNKLSHEELILPAEYEGVVFESSLGFVDPRTKIGELLWEERFNADWLANEKLRMTERGVASQLQQRPVPAGGYVFQRKWFPRVADNDNIFGTYISWDTAGSLNGAYSSGVVGELTRDYMLFVRKVVRKKVLFPQLQEFIQELATEFQSTLKMVVIENKSSGIQAAQTLRQESPEWLAEKIFAFNPKGAKDVRGFQAATYVEKGCVMLPLPSPNFVWLPDFEEEIFMFPATEYKDQTDAFSQLVIYLRNFLSDGWRGRTGNTMNTLPNLEGLL